MSDRRSQALTLQSLIERVQSDTALPSNKARNIASSVRSFAKAVGCTLQTEASFPIFRRCIARVNPGAHGIAMGHWANVRSNLKFALQRYGASMVWGLAVIVLFVLMGSMP